MSKKDIHACMEFLQIRSLVGRFRLMKLKESCSSAPCFFVLNFPFSSLSLSPSHVNIWCQHILVPLSAFWISAFPDCLSSWTETLRQIAVRERVCYCALDKYFERHQLRPSVAAFFCHFSSFFGATVTENQV